MRAILNVSLPEETKQVILARAKKANKSISAYILYTIELAESLIQEDELVAMAKKAEKDYKAGKTRKLTSLGDLKK
jgi:uncharacterized protein (DUF1778 family)